MNSMMDERCRSEWDRLISEWVHNEVDRALLRRRLLDGVCFEDLADEFCLSVTRTKERVYKAQKQLFSHA